MTVDVSERSFEKTIECGLLRYGVREAAARSMCSGTELKTRAASSSWPSSGRRAGLTRRSSGCTRQPSFP